MYRLKTVSVWHVRNRSNRFAGGRLFTVNNIPQVKCKLYHSYSRWCRKACRYLREILTYRDQRIRCVKLVQNPQYWRLLEEPKHTLPRRSYNGRSPQMFVNQKDCKKVASFAVLKLCENRSSCLKDLGKKRI